MDYQLFSDQITSEADGVIRVKPHKEGSGLISNLLSKEENVDFDFDAVVELNRDSRGQLTTPESASSALQNEYGVNTDDLEIVEVETWEHRNVPFSKVYIKF